MQDSEAMGGRELFERMTDRARRTIVLAQEEARLLGHDYIGTEHILLGLVHEGEGVACQALGRLGVELDIVRNTVEDLVGLGGSSPSGHIPFTPRAKKVFECSLREALQLGHNYIGTEHILLGLIREGDGVGAQVLKNFGVELSLVRQTVIRCLAGYAITFATAEPTMAAVEVRNAVMVDFIEWDGVSWGELSHRVDAEHWQKVRGDTGKIDRLQVLDFASVWRVVGVGSVILRLADNFYIIVQKRDFERFEIVQQ